MQAIDINWPLLIGGALALTVIVAGLIILFLRWVLVEHVNGAVNRLEHDAEAARAREAELNRRIRQADEELAQRKKELDQLEQKMKGELEAEAQKHKEELINKARADAEEIIIKAQNAADGIRREIEKQMDLKIVDQATKILNDVLSKKAKGALEKDLVEEFIAQLGSIDMSKISLEIKSVDVVTACGLGEEDLKHIAETIRSKTGRDIQVRPKTDSGHISGVVVQFGSLHLDGSLKTAIRESAIALKAEVEKSYLKK